MQTLRLSLIVLLGLTAGCRELGSYLSPDEVSSCIDGSRTEGCPQELDPTATAVFTLPLIAPGQLNEPATSRFVAVDALVSSTVEMDRIDLQCRGFQLASWRPDRVLESPIQGTIDLLPCRSVGTAREPDVDGVVLHEIPIEIAVYDPIGARVLIDDLVVLANLTDTQVPGVGIDAAGPTVLSLGEIPSEPVLLGDELLVMVISEGAIPLATPPELYIDGVRVDVEFVPNPDRTIWSVNLASLAPKYAPGTGTSFDVMARGLVTVTIRGIGEGREAGIYQRVLQLDREIASLEPESFLPEIPFSTSKAPSILEPVVTVDGVLYVDTFTGLPSMLDWNGEQHFYSAPPPPSSETAATVSFAGFAANGAFLWQIDLPLGGLQWYLEPVPGAPGLPSNLVPYFEPGSADKFRLGDGSICIETAPGAADCGATPIANWFFSCIGPGSEESPLHSLALPSGVALGGAGLHAPLHSGWLSTAYGAPEPACAPAQLVGRRATNPEVFSPTFGAGYQPPSYDQRPDFVAMPSGPDHAVMGHQDQSGLYLERIHGETGASDGTYFVGVPALQRPRPQDLLFATSDGGVWVLSPDQVLSKWLPGEGAPSATLELGQWVGGGGLQVPAGMIPVTGDAANPNTSGNGRRVKGLPHVEHGDGSVTVALVDAASVPVVLELSTSLEPRWAWRSSLRIDPADEGKPVAVYGLPDAPRVVVAKYFGAYDPNSKLVVLAR